MSPGCADEHRRCAEAGVDRVQGKGEAPAASGHRVQAQCPDARPKHAGT